MKTDKELNIIDSYVEKQFVSGYITGSTLSIYNLEGNIFAYMPFSPVIYQVSQNDVSPVFQLSVPDRQFPPSEFLREKSANNAVFFNDLIKSDYVSHFQIEETADGICIFYIANEQRFIGFYDKATQKTYHYALDKFQKYLQTGNVFTFLTHGKVDDYYVMALIVSELKDKKENGYLFKEPLNSMIDKSHENDNPILFLFKLAK